MNSVTNHFEMLTAVNSHRGLKTPYEHLMKSWQVFVGKNLAIDAQDHDENSSRLLCYTCGVVEPPERHKNFWNPLKWY